MEESENTLFTLIFQRESNSSLIFVLILKILSSKIIADLAYNQLEKFVEKEIISVPSSAKQIIRKNRFLKLHKYFKTLKYILYLLALGIFLPIDLKKIIRKIRNLLIYLFYTYIKKEKPPRIPELPKEIKVVFKEIIKPSIIAEKVSEKAPSVIDIIDKMRISRECRFFKEFVFNQPELMEKMTEGQGVKETVFDRISAYCTAEVERAVKRFITAMQQQPVTEGIKVVMKEAKKVSSSLDLLQASLNNGQPRNIIDLKKFILMSKDYEAVMKSLDAYQLLLKYNTTPETLEFFRNHVLPDVFVVLCAIGKEGKK
jgi:hypothetical protein